MPLGAALLLMMFAALGASPTTAADDALITAQALLGAWHEDPTRLDRARAVLEAVPDPSAETLTELSRVWSLTGDFRLRNENERVAAYEHGVEAARRAIAATPSLDKAHLWLAINNGRIAEIKGVTRALGLIGIIREESETVLKLNPTSAEGLILAGGLAAEMPAFMGGDRAKAEALLKRALELDPRLTGGRIELAKLYIATRRWSDAHRELQSIVDETAPTDLPRWILSDRPRAQMMLADLRERGRIPSVPVTAPPQAP